MDKIVNDNIGQQKNALMLIDPFFSSVTRALLPENPNIFGKVKEFLKKARLQTQISLREATHSAETARPALQATGSKPQPTVSPRQRTDFRAHRKPTAIQKLVLMQKLPVKDLMRRTKETVKKARTPIQFRLKHPNLSPNAVLDEAQNTIRDGHGRIIFRNGDKNARKKVTFRNRVPSWQKNPYSPTSYQPRLRA